jgi:hypothetical protein
MPATVGGYQCLNQRAVYLPAVPCTFHYVQYLMHDAVNFRYKGYCNKYIFDNGFT